MLISGSFPIPIYRKGVSEVSKTFLMLISIFICCLALFEMEQDGSRTAVVNGDWVLNFNGEYKASGGTIARYSRHDETETIEVEGPTKTTLQLMILTV